MIRLEIILIVIVAIVITIPIAMSAYTPEGKYIWWTLNPATNNTKGGVTTFNCPAGEFAYGITELGVVVCSTPAP